mmetsp:Transcript_19987/g.23951  ORF Transcript_19987/g.23951 Transcript_19987/m.23951 type:complete len:336 (-) Transcript_19987:137-1144(-)|eukprot:CAMPEP_0197846908 /NCGR_PEP_ID=MMETSP1438-20131217/4710_1 /TAXON_ID=1461541 /ORGANISM="Pterosperma sp., Strain CCMP1384" /LENGTH=335 /DNA_ID=CAMNT_0043458693 /DNA_START=68 /DNA_END=1075 /DNA_ORIENTATION=+
MVKNSAFVFIKPHAVTEATKNLVSSGLKAKGLKIKSEGPIAAEKIDQDKLIDQHYYAIASKATLLKPHQLNVPAEKFKAKFGLDWQAALDKGIVYNAIDGCAKLGMDSEQLDKEWGKAKKADKLVKFGGGFYCGLIKDIYIFNGFFMSMRSKFVLPGTSIYYYVVEWDSKDLSWADFRGSVLGPTDPADAPADSMRGLIMAKWKELGLKEVPNTGDNGVHASASPFEALAERMNWLGQAVKEDSFGAALLSAGIPLSTIIDWSTDPQVKYGAESPYQIKASLFDTLEDTDSDYCLALAKMVAGDAPSADAMPLVPVSIGVAVGAALAYVLMKTKN